jgi:hypothetical protein
MPSSVESLVKPFAFAASGLLFLLGMDFLDLSFKTLKLGPGGVELESFERQREEVADAAAALEEQLVALDGRLAQLEKRANGETASIPTPSPGPASVSDAVAQLARPLDEKEGTLAKGGTGYIWLGNFEAPSEWSPAQLARPDGQPVESPPESLPAGATFRVLGNMTLRGSLPPDTLEYYRATERLGVVPRNTAVELLDKPEVVDRNGLKQYWGRVRVLE